MESEPILIDAKKSLQLSQKACLFGCHSTYMNNKTNISQSTGIGNSHHNDLDDES